MDQDSSGIRLETPPGALVLPGHHLATLVDTPDRRAVVRLGAGVMQQGSALHSCRAGHFRHDERRNKIWIEANQKRYVPALEDMIVGVVIERHSEDYRLDINGTDTATLSATAFEGATKKNKPNLAIGALVYARVIRASKNMEAEVSCIQPGSSKSWVGGETLYGELKGGNMVQVSLGLTKALLTRGGILSKLGQKVPFESAVGVNGRVWMKAGTLAHTTALSRAIENADEYSVSDWNRAVNDAFLK